ncbi:MAG: alpha-ketoglutarate-dependent dioxygenase AlkB [Myxococcales bacterium]|nr:alpha-ketoglutarate-dependent dioxygenase AlkB [Myxococcales bacterium]
MPFERLTLGGNAWVDYDGSWLSYEHMKRLHRALVEEVAWSQRPITVFGKEVLQPRLIGWAGLCPYRYSNQTLAPKPYGPVLHALLRDIQAVTGLEFNHVLLNRYRNGSDHMGPHADDEPELGPSPQIAALSLGASRKFVLEPKPKKLRHRKVVMSLEPGSLMVMGGRIQHGWRHAVPKQLKVENERINVTFRKVIYDPGQAPKRLYPSGPKEK